MLHRFRNTSMSLRHKPKLWGKDKEKKGKNSGDHSDLSREAFMQHHDSWTPSETGESSNATGSAGFGSPELGGTVVTGTPTPLPPPPPIPVDRPVMKNHGDKPVKKESRFGLGRKKSVNML